MLELDLPCPAPPPFARPVIFSAARAEAMDVQTYSRSHASFGPGLRASPGIARRYARRVLALVAAGVSLLLVGCALGYLNPNFAVPKERRERLTEAANGYASALRFGNLGAAAPFVEPDLRDEFVAAFAGDAILRFTDVDVSSVSFDGSIGSGTVLMMARFYRLPSVREILITENQQWRYDPVAARWFISPDFALYETAGVPQRTAPAARSRPPSGPVPASPAP
jgi:hypothetical protein